MATSTKTQPKSTMVAIRASVEGTIRTATLIGQEHTIVPCIALVEGVLWPVNAPSAELALAEEFGRFPQGWDGRPIVMNHPMVDNSAVSASSPGILEEYGFGQVFNTKMVDNKLHMELWINNARVEALGGEFVTTLERLKAADPADPVEVSTGLFMMLEDSKGVHNSSAYNGIWRNIVPDHLAILSKGTIGACSVADGCGAPRTNTTFKPAMRAARLSTLCGCQDKHRDDGDAAKGDDQIGIFQRLAASAGKLFNFTGEGLTTNSQGLSDQDIRKAIYAGLDTDYYCWIVAVYMKTNTTGTFVYEEGYDGELFERTFEIKTDSSVVIGATRTEVRPQTEFVPVIVADVTPTNPLNQNLATNAADNAAPENDMKKDEIVKALVDNAATPYTQDDAAGLALLSEATLTGLLTNATKTEAAPAAPTTSAASPTPAKVTTAAEYIAAAPTEVQEVLNQSLRLHNARKSEIVKGLIANSQCKFSEVQLNSKNLEELEMLASLANVQTYEGQAIGNGTELRANADGDDGFTPAPTALFDFKAA